MRTPEVQRNQRVQVKEQISPKGELIKARGGSVMGETPAAQRGIDLKRNDLFVSSLHKPTDAAVSLRSVGGCDGNDGSRGDGSCIARCR